MSDPRSFSPSMKSEGENVCFLQVLSVCWWGPLRACRAVSTVVISSSRRSLLTGLSSGCRVSPVSSWYTLEKRGMAIQTSPIYLFS